MLKHKCAITLSVLALATTTGCSEFLEDFPFDTFGQVEDCPSCTSTGILVVTAGSTGSNLGTGNFDTTSVGDQTGAPVECADPNDPAAPVEIVDSDKVGTTNWTCDKIYVLEQDAQVVIKSGVLNIQAGTTIKGKSGSALIIEKDAAINAVGTADKPIVFTSSRPTDQARGDWGGLVFLGKAPTNQGTDIPAEGFATPRTYGGTDATHNCGTLQYVRVEWAGFALSTDNELNAITFYGCGSQTQMDHVQVHMGLDDGIEWFGGGFDAHHLIVTGAKDDSLDLDLGFTGVLQHIFIHQDPAVGDNGFEVSNNELDFKWTPITKPKIANLTFVGSGETGQKSRAFTFKQGADYEIYNSIAVNSKNELFQFQSAETQTYMTGGQATIKGSILDTADDTTPLVKTDDGFTLDAVTLENWLKEPSRENHVRGDAGLPSAAWGSPNIKPAVGGLASTGATTLPAEFVPTTYVGAVDPEAATDWTKAAWTNYSVE